MKLTLKQTLNLFERFEVATENGFLYAQSRKAGVLELDDTWMQESLHVASADLSGTDLTLIATKGVVAFGGTVPGACVEYVLASLRLIPQAPSPEQVKAALAGKKITNPTRTRKG